jgi:hypothetical protein
MIFVGLFNEFYAVFCEFLSVHGCQNPIFSLSFGLDKHDDLRRVTLAFGERWL